MSVYVIHAYDDLFQGARGLENWAIEEGDSFQMADIAADMSREIIESSEDISGVLKDRAHDYLSYDIEENNLTEMEQDSLFESYYFTCIEEDILFTVIKLSNEHTLQEYINLLKNEHYSYEDLIDEFGEEEEIY